MRFHGLIALLLLIGCDSPPDVVFAEPLPVGSADLPRFPRRVQGEYTLSDDTARQLAILPSAVVRRWWIKAFWDTQSEADSLHEAGFQIRILAKQGDSAQLTLLTTDTVFALTSPARSRLRRKAGYYYLNQREDSGHWTSQRLRIRGAQAHLAGFTRDSARVTALPEARLLPASQGARRFLLQLTKAQQKKFLRDSSWWYAATADTVYIRRRPPGTGDEPMQIRPAK